MIKKTVIGIVSALTVGFIALAIISNHYANLEMYAAPTLDPHADLEAAPFPTSPTYDLSGTMLGETEYQAILGGHRRDGKKGPEWDGYCVRIYLKSPMEENAWIPMFSRWLNKADVSSRFWTNDVENIVNYDETTRDVTFDVGFTNYTYRLPEK